MPPKKKKQETSDIIQKTAEKPVFSQQVENQQFDRQITTVKKSLCVII